MRVIIAGSRDFTDYNWLHEEVYKTLTELHKKYYNVDNIYNPDTTIISGTARGADQLGERFAEQYNLNLVKFPADWNKYGKSAGHIRNEQMAKYAVEDHDGIAWLIAFLIDGSRGTSNMITTANAYQMSTYIIHV